MAITLTRADGSVIQADSPEELAQYEKALDAIRNGTRPKGRRGKQRVVVSDEELPEHAQELAALLLKHSDGMASAEVGKHFGVDARGIGGYVTSLTNWGRRHGFTKRQMVKTDRRDNGHGHSVRRIRLADFFREKIKKGEVPGVKLDT